MKHEFLGEIATLKSIIVTVDGQTVEIGAENLEWHSKDEYFYYAGFGEVALVIPVFLSTVKSGRQEAE